MARKRRPADKNPAAAIHASSERSPLERFLAGPYAKWAFFAVYLLLTVFIFRGFLFSGGMLFGSDTIPDGVYTRQYYKDFHHEFGGVPRWNPLILGGLPFVDAMHGDTFYPGAWIQFFLPITRALGQKLVWHVFLAGVFMYAFLRTLRLRRDAAFLGGLMYMLAPSFVSLVFPAHDAKMYVTAFLPLAFALLESGMNAPRLYKAVLLGGVMGLLILTSHVQMAYYAWWALGLYFLFRVITARGEGAAALAKRTGLFAGAVALALALGLVQLLPSYRFTTTQSVRAGGERTGYTYATSWSMHPEEVAGMLVPSFQGYQSGLDRNLYWGKNPFKLNSEYNGILPILLAVLAVVMYRTSRTWFFLGLGALALVYALGAETPVYRLFYALVPGVKNFRAPGMIIFLFAFAAVTLSAGFLSSFLEEADAGKRRTGKRLLYAAGGILLAALALTLAAGPLFALWKGVLYGNIPQDRAETLALNIPFFTRDLWRVAILSAAALAGLWMFRARKTGAPALVALIALAAVIDSAVVDARYIATIDPDAYPGLAPDRSVADIREKLKADPNARILNTIISLSRIHSPNYYAMFGIRSADGAHNNELRTYELFRGQNGMNFLYGWVDFQKGGIDPNSISANNFLRVAGVKYVLLPMGEGRIELMENGAALERAFIVHGYVTAPDDTAAVGMLKDASFNPAKTAVLDREPDPKPAAPIAPAAVSRVEKLNYGAKNIAITADLAAPGIVTLSENMVPYWTARIDGKEVPVLRAYGTFMAVAAPAGKHEIVFAFRSGPYETGKRASLAALAFIVVSLAACGGYSAHHARGVKRKAA